MKLIFASKRLQPDVQAPSVLFMDIHESWIVSSTTNKKSFTLGLETAQLMVEMSPRKCLCCLNVLYSWDRHH